MRPEPDEDAAERARTREWLFAQRAAVEGYLAGQRLTTAGRPVPRWDIAPYVAVWQIRGGWVISGDLPTDYVLAEDTADALDGPRAAVRFFADKFRDLAERMLAGQTYPGIRIGDPTNPEQQRELGGLLRSRAGTLADFADDDGLWPDQLDEWQEKLD
ncbi:MAG: DUF4826 family protein [Gemmataceae bacterium]|nr:DUF4826 family protein [Gemmataceae bacterium]